MTQTLILASASPYRKKMLVDAGLAVEALRADLDERAVEAALKDSGTTPDDLAQILAEAKATEVSERHAGALVLGCDQTLSIDGEVLHKPADMEAARRRLLVLSGRTHRLASGVALVRDGQTLWRDVQVAHLTMRSLTPAFIGQHLARVGPAALTSVGAYQIEGEGIQLFDRVEGDYFTIVGLPLLQVLKALRGLDFLDG